MQEYKSLPLDFVELPAAKMQANMESFLLSMQRRRTVRDYADRPVPPELIANALRCAGSAPSGANRQPWHFVAVSNPLIKREIRLAAEQEEREFYQRRASEEWLQALAPLGTDADKPFLELAPWLIAIFQKKHTTSAEGEKMKNYYTCESVGIATGLLIAALHQAGLACLTHTPSPMKFLNSILGRPVDEKPYLLLVTGFPAANATVPAIEKYSLEQISTFLS